MQLTTYASYFILIYIQKSKYHRSPFLILKFSWVMGFKHACKCQLESFSFDSRKRQLEERKTEAQKHSKSTGVCIVAFLLLSNKPIRSSITITWPTFVFSSFTVFIPNHFGLSWETQTKEQTSKDNIIITVVELILTWLDVTDKVVWEKECLKSKPSKWISQIDLIC